MSGSGSNFKLGYNVTEVTQGGAHSNPPESGTSGGGGGTGTVTSVGTGTGLTGGPITTAGTISIAATAVTPGSYTNANITVNAEGQLTAAANGSSGGGGTVTSVGAGTGLTASPSPITGAGTLSLTAIGSPTGPIGSATTTPVVTINAEGQVTALTSATISGVAPGGSAGGDLTGTYPNPTVAKLEGNAVASGTPSLSQVLRWTSGSTWAPKFIGYVYPEDYGAVANGTTDDSTAIMNAYAAVAALGLGHAIFFGGKYGIGSGTALVFNSDVGIECSPTAQFNAISNQANLVTIENGGNCFLRIPGIFNFSGYGLRISNCSLCRIFAGTIQGNNTSGTVGVDFYTDSSAGCLDNTVEVQSIGAVQYANRIFLNGTGAFSQGNYSYVNFATACATWVLLTSGATVTQSAINENTFVTDAWDPTGWSGAASTVVGIVNSGQGAYPFNKFICRGFWFTPTAGGGWLNGGTSTSNNLDCCDFEFGMNVPGVSGTTAQQYAMVSNPEYRYGEGCRYTVNATGKFPNNTGISCGTSAAARSTWNSGNAIPFNRILIAMAVSSLANGSTATFYAYHPFVQGNAKIMLVPSTDSGSVLGCMVDSVTDNTSVNANEIKIVLRNVSGSSQTGTVPMMLIVGVP